MDEPRASYTEWSKSERQISYINTNIWNLEWWYWWTYLQGSNGDADIEKRLVDTLREGEGGTNRESGTETCITICKTDSQWEMLYDARSSSMVLCDHLEGWDEVGGGREVPEGGHIGWFMLMHGRKNNYPPIKNKYLLKNVNVKKVIPGKISIKLVDEMNLRHLIIFYFVFL